MSSMRGETSFIWILIRFSFRIDFIVLFSIGLVVDETLLILVVVIVVVVGVEAAIELVSACFWVISVSIDGRDEETIVDETRVVAVVGSTIFDVGVGVAIISVGCCVFDDGVVVMASCFSLDFDRERCSRVWFWRTGDDEDVVWLFWMMGKVLAASSSFSCIFMGRLGELCRVGKGQSDCFSMRFVSFTPIREVLAAISLKKHNFINF